MEDTAHARLTLSLMVILGSLSFLAVPFADFGSIISHIFLATGICTIGMHVGKNPCCITKISPISASACFMPTLSASQPGRTMPKPSVGIPMTIPIWIGRATMRNRY